MARRCARRLAALLAMTMAIAPARAAPTTADPAITAAYGPIAARIIAAATSPQAEKEAWVRLAELTDTYPARLSGSASLEAAIRWSAETMRRDGIAHVRLDPVIIPPWKRGIESAAIVGPAPLQPRPLAITTLGGSIGTGDRPIEAEVLILNSFDDLAAHAADAKGRIVLYNVPFDEGIEPIDAYRIAAPYRNRGPSRAAAFGAVAVLVRSVGPMTHHSLHTGMMRYADDARQIPAAAIAAEDADALQRIVDRGQTPRIRLSLGARTLPDAASANVIAELPGREHPEQIVLLSAHIDSWDLAGGAMDDGGGCIAIWQALRLLDRLGLQPRRTIRIVLFTNEENGLRGGLAYRDRYAAQLGQHILAMETDTGTLPIRGYGFAGPAKARAKIAGITALLAPVGGTELNESFEGPDIAPIVKAGAIPTLSLDMELHRYFQVHHTPADTVDKIAPADLARLIAAMATQTYIVADMADPGLREAP